MAVAAVHLELTGVELVAEGHRLDRPVAHVGVFGREVVPDEGDAHDGSDSEPGDRVERCFVGPLREDLRQRLASCL